MKIREINAMRGPNYWSVRRHKLIVMVLDLEDMEEKPSDKIVNDWLASLANNQFTLDEIGNGTAYEVLKKNYG